MQHTLCLKNYKSGGGRISSAKLRDLQAHCEDFTGLEEGVNRYDLLLLVKKVGKIAGFSPRMIHLLDYYMAYTRDIDWEEGSRPIVYKSIASTALDMGVSERQIQALEKKLFEIGAITWNDSGNHRRYGQRCDESGQILYAYGVDLTPLSYLRAALEDKLHEKQLYDQAWKETKRQISYYRRQIRALLLDGQERLQHSDQVEWINEADLIRFFDLYNAIAKPIRTYMDLNQLRDQLKSHKALFLKIEHKVKDHYDDNNNGSNDSLLFHKDSAKDDSNNINNKYTTYKQSNKLDTCRDQAQSFQKSVAVPSQDNLNLRGRGDVGDGAGGSRQKLTDDQDIVSSTGLQHVTLKQLLNIASDRFKDHLPIHARPMNHSDFIEAAYQLKNTFGISQASWGYACVTLGRVGAAVCLILTDQATLREENRVMRPGAYFNAMINRAKTGELKLHQSIMGHLKRECANDADISEQGGQI